jgi:hypothetical protein
VIFTVANKLDYGGDMSKNLIAKDNMNDLTHPELTKSEVAALIEHLETRIEVIKATVAWLKSI